MLEFGVVIAKIKGSSLEVGYHYYGLCYLLVKVIKRSMMS